MRAPATPLQQFSVANGEGKGTPHRKKMDTPIQEAARTAQQVAEVGNVWQNLLLAFVIGGAVSAVWTWKEGRRKLKGSEVVSTFLSSGAIAAAFVAYLMDKQISTPMVVCISIMTGFAGDIVIRGSIRAFQAAVNRILGNTPRKERDEPEDE